MGDLRVRFEAAYSTKLKERPDNATLLRLYALYKQATIGDIAGTRPNTSDIIGCAKYDAWSKLKGTTNFEAMNQYIELVESLKARLATYFVDVGSSDVR